MYHRVNFVQRLCLLSLGNQSDYHWFVLLHNCLNYNKLPSLFLESSCVYGLRSTDSNIYSVPKIMRTCSAGGFPYAALFDLALHHHWKGVLVWSGFVRVGYLVSAWASDVCHFGAGVDTQFQASRTDFWWLWVLEPMENVSQLRAQTEPLKSG